MKRQVVVLLIMLMFFQPAFYAFGSDGKDEGIYAGAGVCQECHVEQTKSMSRTPHWKKAIKDSPVADKGCESCHGSGASHVREGGGTIRDLITFSKKETAMQKSGVCLNCHEESKNMSSWDSGTHKKNDITCIDCHTVHNSAIHNLKASQPNLCLSCHKSVGNQLKRQAHHPIQEGKVKCTSCHTPHGGSGPKMIKADSAPDLCYKCHTEKRGPFAFEHPPVAENCGTCHQPHGSNHENLLTSRPPRLCQGCHSTSGHNNRPYSFQNSFGGSATSSRNRFVSKGCVNCHGDIHGSNRSPFMVR
jgi:DmsE family decaheme c-type cytochrome